jgi:hypothetical protein
LICNAGAELIDIFKVRTIHVGMKAYTVFIGCHFLRKRSRCIWDKGFWLGCWRLFWLRWRGKQRFCLSAQWRKEARNENETKAKNRSEGFHGVLLQDNLIGIDILLSFYIYVSQNGLINFRLVRLEAQKTNARER